MSTVNFRAVCLSCRSELLSMTKIKEVFCLYNKIVCFCYRVIICVSYMISVWRGMGVSVTNVSVVHRWKRVTIEVFSSFFSVGEEYRKFFLLSLYRCLRLPDISNICWPSTIVVFDSRFGRFFDARPTCPLCIRREYVLPALAFYRFQSDTYL